MASGLFVTATGRGQGKTWVTRGITRSLRRKDVRVAALKPIETGCAPDPKDALILAHTSMEPELVDCRDFHRVASNLSPYAATMEGAPAPPHVDRIAARIRTVTSGYPMALVEGVGGLMTPIDRSHTVADLIKEVGFPVLLVAKDEYGVVSDILAHVQVADSMGLRLDAVVLVRHDAKTDESRGTNQRLLAQRLPFPVRVFPSSRNDDEALADAADSADLPNLLS